MKIKPAVAVALAATIALAGLAFSEPPRAEEATALRVGYIPVGVYSYLWHAKDAGYFEEENLKVELVPMAGGGQIIPALQSGALQFGISDALGVLNARKGGIPVTYVSFNYRQSSDDPIHAVLTMNPGIKEAADLEGKSVATNLSYNTDWTMMREWLRKHDVEVQSVRFVEIPFPDMLAALRNDVVAAVGAVEPFVTQGEKQGARVIGHYFTDVKSPIAFTGVVSMMPYVKNNKSVVRRFVRAINRAIGDFKNPEIVRKTIAANTKIPPSVTQTMNLGEWSKSIRPEKMKFWVDAAKKEGIINATTHFDSLVWQLNEGDDVRH